MSHGVPHPDQSLLPAILNRRAFVACEQRREAKAYKSAAVIFVSVTVVTEAETGSFQDKVARPPFLRNAVFLYRLPNHPEAERFADEIVRARPGTLREWIGAAIWSVILSKF